MPEAYPLSWRLSVPRTPPHERQRARFGKRNERGWGTNRLTVKQARDRLFGELGRYGRVDPDDVVVSTNVRTRNDGLPYSNAKEPDDPGACVYFEFDGFPVALPCDTFDRSPTTSPRSLATSRPTGARSATAWARPRSGTQASRRCRSRDPERRGGRCCRSIEARARMRLRGRTRKRAAKAHPDRGGSSSAFHLVQQAYNQAMMQFAETDA